MTKCYPLPPVISEEREITYGTVTWVSIPNGGKKKNTCTYYERPRPRNYQMVGHS